MPLHSDEAAFIRAFILPERQERWQLALASEKHRSKTLHRLADSRDFSTDRMTVLDRTLTSGEAIWKHLANLGANESCHVISEIEDLDGRDMPTQQALEECVGMGLGTVLSLIPGRLAYFEEENVKRRWVLRC